MNSGAVRSPHPTRELIELLTIHRYQVPVVTGEQFVSAIAGQRHRHVFSRHAADIIGG